MSVAISCGGNALRCMMAGYSRKARAEKLLVMLQGYFDDSESKWTDRRLYFAGYVNYADKWIEFSEKWAEALQKHPAIEYLHMVEAENRRGQFKGWGKLDIHLKLMSLARVIREFDPWSLHFSISRNQHKKIVAPVAPYPFTKPYFYCYMGVLIGVARLQERLGVYGAVDFIFDEQSAFQADAVALYNMIKYDLKPEWRSMLGSTPYFETTKMFCHYRRRTCFHGMCDVRQLTVNSSPNAQFPIS